MSSPPETFELLVGRYARVMSSAIRKVCGRRHRELVADVEQEVRLALWKRLQGGKEIEHPVSYLHKMALTTALAVLRKIGPEVSVGEREAIENPLPPARGLTRAERARLLEQVLERLSLERRRALQAWLAGFNHREVATMYGWSESVARHRIYRGIEEIERMTRKGTDDD